MSLPRPSGLKAPSKIGKPTGLPQPKSAIPATEKAKSKALLCLNVMYGNMLCFVGPYYIFVCYFGLCE